MAKFFKNLLRGAGKVLSNPLIGGGAGWLLAGPLGGLAGGALSSLAGEQQDSRRERRASNEQNRQLSGQIQEQANAVNALRGTLQNERADTESRLSETQRKINRGIMRSNRSRLRGGIFGDEPTQGLLQRRLG